MMNKKTKTLLTKGRQDYPLSARSTFAQKDILERFLFWNTTHYKGQTIS